MWLLNPYRFGVSAPTDPFFSNVSLLLHGDGANGSTTIIDSSPSPKAVTVVGNTQISTVQSRFGGASIVFDGNGDYCSVATNAAFEFGAGDGTIEAWVYPRSLSGTQVLVEMRPIGPASASNIGVAVYLGGSTLSVAKSRIEVLQAGGTLALNSWHHVAWTRLGSSNRLFLNGVLVSTVVDSTVYPSTLVYLGVDSFNTGPTAFYNGYIDDLRITKGVARYTANFTTPTAPFPDF